ncbi:unnamed protein product [Sphagnum jensenii]
MDRLRLRDEPCKSCSVLVEPAVVGAVALEGKEWVPEEQAVLVDSALADSDDCLHWYKLQIHPIDHSCEE